MRKSRYRQIARLAAAAAAALVISGCGASSQEAGGLRINDPLEPSNRITHKLNVAADRSVLRPLSKGYEAVTPGLARLLLRNAIAHLELPKNFINHTLQGEFADAGYTLARFSVNTIVGAGGLLDPATDVGLPHIRADFGQTLAAWGVGEGVYLEAPLLGPAFARGASGQVVDIFLNPATYLLSPLVLSSARGVGIVDRRARYGLAVDLVLYERPDSYRALRQSYYQNRRRFVSGLLTFDDAVSFD